MIEPGQLILLISHKGKRYLRKLEAGGEVHTHDGKLLMDDIVEAGFGQYVQTHLGKAYLVLKPTLHDLIKGVKRQTQIMYPKEIGYLMMKLGIGPGSTVIESGTGSGGLTTALAWFVGDTGKVITYERRADFFKLAGKNLERVGLSHRVEQVNQNIEDGFLHSGADALFLDVRTPWEYLPSIPSAVIPGAMCGFLLPTVNQVSDLLRGLEDGPFADLEVLEILVRRWKPVADRLRPDDRMVAHTGFLVFARYMEPPAVRPRSEVAAAPEEVPAVEVEDLSDAPDDVPDEAPDNTEF
ncbi:tRNA (adenine-N1)-methyltransferase [uncultured Pseudodesulfovibrio sp.]|uniref:tRNA (adenine-N1)-methyltransferase n=1 Tax=uncultured Pseudodesulfovibrio sp. TaxID=2035858 RepID=UPI0029C7A77F|nr:tRNA (adenine-N1)-methyltransferase [uncultured Pseudodesulfovibrio sp.]